MSSPYTIRRTKIAPEDPILARLPTVTGLVVPSDRFAWEPLFGFTGLSAIRMVNVGDTVAILSKVELAGDLFCVVKISSYAREEFSTLIIAVRNGKIRAHVDIDTEDFYELILTLANLQFGKDSLINVLDDVKHLMFARLSGFNERLLLSLREFTVLFDPASLIPVAAIVAFYATVDPSSSTLPSCVALSWVGMSLFKLLRFDANLRVMAKSEEKLNMNYTSVRGPRMPDFLNVALTLRGQIVTLDYETRGYGGVRFLRIFDPDFREVHREVVEKNELFDLNLVAVAGKPESDGGSSETQLLLLKNRVGENSKQHDYAKKDSSPGWLLEIEAANGRYVSEE